jgi:DNA-binding transcriptional MocR family regulator
MEQAASATYITPSQLGQAVVFEFLSRGSFEPHLERLRAGLRLRRDAMLTALAEHMPEARCTRPEGGFFLWVELPGMPDGRAVLARAEGVTALAGTSFSAMSCWLRLSYCHATPDEIETGVKRLAAAL